MTGTAIARPKAGPISTLASIQKKALEATNPKKNAIIGLTYA
jgi:hypothetical protein